MKLRNYILYNFPFLEDDFDALTDYELFSKMVGYMKKMSKQFDEFQTRLDKYENYFNNLDVQEEINNKLEEMYNNGELASIVAQFLDLGVEFIYDTVSDLVDAANLVNGCYAKTNGFYSYDDGGGAYYKIRTIEESDTTDGITLIALDDDTLVAELLYKDTMNVKQFGAKGDGETDDTAYIQKALNNCKNIIINNGTYMVDAETGILPKSNSNIKLVNATIKAIDNNLTNYNVILFDDVDNIILSGGIISGDKDTHTGDSGEWGHCISIKNGSSNIIIKDMILTQAWGDGVYLNDASYVDLENLIINDNSRNGISVIKGNNIIVDGCEISHTDRTDPQSGIDLEPNINEGDVINNVFIKNCFIHNNKLGIGGYDNNQTVGYDGIKNVSIINNNFDTISSHCMSLEYIKNFDILSNTITNCGNIGIRLIRALNCNIKNNICNVCDGSGITFSIASNIMVDNNQISTIGTGQSAGIIATDSDNSFINNNIIHDCQHTGIQVQGTTGNTSANIIVSNNKVYNCGLVQGYYYDVELKKNVEKSIILNNDLRSVDNTYTRACIVASDNTNETNIIKGNIMNPKVATTMNIGNNITCDNIISGELYEGNITRN